MFDGEVGGGTGLCTLSRLYHIDVVPYLGTYITYLIPPIVVYMNWESRGGQE